MKNLKRVSVLVIALIAMAPAAWSQTAKEVLTKVFENVEKNYKLADIYKHYDARLIRTEDDSLVKAFNQDLIINYPKKITKNPDIVWYSNKGFPKKDFRLKKLSIDVVRNWYSRFIKDPEHFFSDKDSMTLSDEGNQYVINWISRHKKNDYHSVLYINKSDFAIVAVEGKACYHAKKDKTPNALRWVVIKPLARSIYHSYGKKNGKYELLSYRDSGETLWSNCFIGKKIISENCTVDFSGYCDNPEGKKNKQESMSREEASALAAEIGK